MISVFTKPARLFHNVNMRNQPIDTVIESQPNRADFPNRIESPEVMLRMGFLLLDGRRKLSDLRKSSASAEARHSLH